MPQIHGKKCQRLEDINGNSHFKFGADEERGHGISREMHWQSYRHIVRFIPSSCLLKCLNKNHFSNQAVSSMIREHTLLIPTCVLSLTVPLPESPKESIPHWTGINKGTKRRGIHLGRRGRKKYITVGGKEYKKTEAGERKLHQRLSLFL